MGYLALWCASVLALASYLFASFATVVSPHHLSLAWLGEHNLWDIMFYRSTLFETAFVLTLYIHLVISLSLISLSVAAPTLREQWFLATPLSVTDVAVNLALWIVVLRDAEISALNALRVGVERMGGPVRHFWLLGTVVYVVYRLRNIRL